MSDNGNRNRSISCKAIKGLLIFLEKNYGKEALTQYLGKLGLSYAYLSDSDNWISWDVYLKMLDEFVLYTGTPASLFKAGEYSLGPDIWENVWYLVITNLLTIKTMFKNGVLQNPKFNQAADWEVLELTNNRMKLKIKWKDGIKTTRNSCLHRHGLIVRVPTVSGMPPAQFRELQCQTDGHDCCIEEYTWQNKPLRLFSLMLPVVLTSLYLIAGQFDIVKAGLLDTSLFTLITFLAGYIIDDSKILKAVSRINFEQNRQLEKSFAKLEDKYDELKKAEEIIMTALNEKEVLLKEVHHRVKNNMQVIISLLNIQSGQIDDKRFLDMLTESRDRIRAMALVHEKLYQSKDLANIDLHDYIKSLANHLLTSYNGRRTISLRLDVTDVQLNIDIAIPCGLIINELVSNSLKHAFPAEREGEVKISFRKKAGKGYELTVSDNGAGIPENIIIGETKTLGLQLVTSLVEHQLQGLLKLNRTNGTEFYIRFEEPSYKKRI